LEKPIGSTGNHPFWSEDRQEFVRADKLQPGERLKTLQGITRVTNVVARGSPVPVYNIEVQVDHTYHVASVGVLVHNGTEDCLPHFQGTDKPWTSGATPNSNYTHVGPDGKAVQNAIYDADGNVVGHVDFKNHGPSALSGHGHQFPEPGNPASGHGPGKPHFPNEQLPPGWDDLPPGIDPRTPLGE
jgi:hypothetical protein